MLTSEQINEKINQHENMSILQKKNLVNELAESIQFQTNVCKNECNNKFSNNPNWQDKIKKKLCHITCDRKWKDYRN